jgi:S1-C subfamily serine protease
VQRRGVGAALPATTVAFDRRHDVAVLRVPRLRAPALPLVAARAGRSVAILGFPENGPFSAEPGRLGVSTTTVTAVAGKIRHGNSGGPAVDSSGAVATTIFASRIGSQSGFGVATRWTSRALAHAGRRAVSTGACSA